MNDNVFTDRICVVVVLLLCVVSVYGIKFNVLTVLLECFVIGE